MLIRHPRKSFGAQIILGLLIGMLLAAPVSAQFAVTVVADTSPTTLQQVILASQQTTTQGALLSTQNLSYVKQIGEYAEEASRWATKIQQYTETVQRDVQRFTTIKGTLGFAEKQLGLNEDTLQAMASIGSTIRGIYALKNQLTALVTTRLRMIQNIEYRAKAGIFDPAADLSDLEEYLRTSVGKSADNTNATLARLKQFDNELERWEYDLEMSRARLLVVQELRKNTNDKLTAEQSLSTGSRVVTQDNTGGSSSYNQTGQRTSQSAEAIAAMNNTIQQCDAEINRLDVNINELISKIAERYKQYHQKFNDAAHGADQVEKTNQAWDNFMSIKNQAALDLLENYHDGTRPPRLTHAPR